MSVFDPAELASIRADVTATMTDKAYILRVADQAAETASGGPLGGLSNGAGGIRQTAAPAPSNAPAPQFQQVPGMPIPCRLGSFARGMGEFLNKDITQAKASFRIKLPFDTNVLGTDRIRVVTDVDDFVYEVTATEPRTDEFSRSVRASRVQ